MSIRWTLSRPTWIRWGRTSPARTGSIPWLAGLALVGIVSCGGSSGTGESPFSVAEDGPFRAGYRTLDLSYVPQGEDGLRETRLHVWYPTADTEGAGTRHLVIFRDDGVFVDASLAPPLDGDRYPVVVHSHGGQGFAGAHSQIARRLATHGWVAMAPDHVGNTLVGNRDAREAPNFLGRPQDLSAALDLAENLPASDPLSGMLATDRALATAHSVGAYAMWALAGMPYDEDRVRENCTDPTRVPESGCTEPQVQAFVDGFRDPRVVATVHLDGDLDANWFDYADTAVVDVPMLYMYDDVSEDPANVEHDRWISVSVPGACHEAFNLGPWDPRGCRGFDAAQGIHLSSTFTLAFGRRHLFDDRGAEVREILAGVRSVSPAPIVVTGP